MKNLAFLLFITMAFAGCHSNTRTLPILGRHETVEKQVNGETRTDTVYHTIADYRFVDQDSTIITPATFAGKIYVADFFFTTCPTICPVMKTQMLRVYEAFNNNDEVLFLSHSIDPEHDNVAVLRDFANRLGVDSKKWHFITGRKEEIYNIGQGSYMVAAQEDDQHPGGFLHSGAFILVDKDRRIRGIYDGTDEKEVDQLISDIPVLLEEYE